MLHFCCEEILKFGYFDWARQVLFIESYQNWEFSFDVVFSDQYLINVLRRVSDIWSIKKDGGDCLISQKSESVKQKAITVCCSVQINKKKKKQDKQRRISKNTYSYKLDESTKKMIAFEALICLRYTNF